MPFIQRIRYAALSNIGLKRTANEDAYRIEKHVAESCGLEEGRILFVLADGMGGHACGDVASEMACEGTVGFLDKQEKTPDHTRRQLIELFYSIDDQIRTHTIRRPNCEGMGTTLSTMILSEETAVVAHVGDSRVYRYSDGELMLLTTDHTYVHEMVDEGHISPETAATHPYRNKLTQVVGTGEPLEYVDTKILDIVPGDRFLLSTDGLHDSVSFDEIKQILGDEKEPDAAANQLLDLALARGGPDNITLIVVHLPFPVTDVKMQ